MLNNYGKKGTLQKRRNLKNQQKEIKIETWNRRFNVPMRLAKVMISLGLRTGMTDSRSNLIISFFFFGSILLGLGFRLRMKYVLYTKNRALNHVEN